jgi:hypothetical protein
MNRLGSMWKINVLYEKFSVFWGPLKCLSNISLRGLPFARGRFQSPSRFHK